MSGNGIGFLNIQTCVLKVHMDCHGCQKRVKKLLQKIEGVYSVNINAEEQVVMVSGIVDSAILIKRLAKSGKNAEVWSQSFHENSGKHAEVWSPSFHEKLNQEGQASFIRDDQNRINGIDHFKTHQILPFFLGNDVPDHWRLENYLNQNMGMEVTRGEIDQAFMRNAYDEEHEHIEEYDTRAKRVHACFPGNGTDFAGLGGHGYRGFQDIYARKPTPIYEHSPPMMIYNHPSTKMAQPMHNMMVNHNYTYQPHVTDYSSPLTPPYKDVSISSAPYTFY